MDFNNLPPQTACSQCGKYFCTKLNHNLHHQITHVIVGVLATFTQRTKNINFVCYGKGLYNICRETLPGPEYYNQPTAPTTGCPIKKFTLFTTFCPESWRSRIKEMNMSMDA